MTLEREIINNAPEKKNIHIPSEERGLDDKPFVRDSAGEGSTDLYRMIQEDVVKNELVEKIIAKHFFVYKILMDHKRKDEVTFRHVLGVTDKVIDVLGRNEEHLDPDLKQSLILASLVHDAGKTDDIINEVVKCPSSLSKEQCSIMQEHSRKAFNWLKNLGYITAAKILVKHHELGEDEEGLDKSYPRSGDDSEYVGPERRQVEPEIEEAARILAISDVFDALMSKRQYKEAMLIEQCEEVLREKFRTEKDQRNISILVNGYKSKTASEVI